MIVVLGAGPAGLAAAFKLAQRGWRDVTVLERGSRVGGHAGSFVIDGIPVDFGSHRLHPSCPAPVLADIRGMLGADLLDMTRHGRIRLRGRWVRFPLKPLDLVTELPPGFVAGVLVDLVRRSTTFPGGDESFASTLERGLGRTICRDFYFPYAEKIWGLPADALDPEQARRRVAHASLGGLVRRTLGTIAGVRRLGAGRFFYPKHGYGQISEAFSAAAAAAGVTIVLGANVTAVHAQADRRVSRVDAIVAGEERRFEASHVLSTIPLSVLARLVQSDADLPSQAAESLRQRALVLVYLTLDVDRFTEYDAHYFPETAIRMSRLSEPKNYSLTDRPGRTVLCAELPCTVGDTVWSMTDADLGALVTNDLDRAGLRSAHPVAAVQAERLPNAYPLYDRGYRRAFDELDRYVGRIDGLTSFGRQGLFAHDNTHHTMAMAYALVDCFRPDRTLDPSAWAQARRGFEDNVVED